MKVYALAIAVSLAVLLTANEGKAGTSRAANQVR